VFQVFFRCIFNCESESDVQGFGDSTLGKLMITAGLGNSGDFAAEGTRELR
jgi:hypothetical protein